MMTDLTRSARAIIARAGKLARAERHMIATMLAQDEACDDTTTTNSIVESRDAPLASLKALARRTEAERRALFVTPDWARRYRTGLEIHVYIVGCDGTARLAHDLGLPLFKVGTATMGELETRIARLGRDRYASLVRTDAGYLQQEGFALWSPPPRLQLGAPQPRGPVRVASTSFVVGLQAGMTHAEFEAELNRRLRPISLRHFADSDAGRAHCAARGVDPSDLVRFGLRGRPDKIAGATEIMRIRPQADGPALAAVLEDIVIDAVSPTRPACRLGTSCP